MEQIKVFYDETGHSLTVWFDDPRSEAIAEEIGDDVVLMKSRDGRVIGFEKLNVHYLRPNDVQLAYEHAA